MLLKIQNSRETFWRITSCDSHGYRMEAGEALKHVRSLIAIKECFVSRGDL